MAARPVEGCIRISVAVIALLSSAAAWAETGRLYIRRVEVEPRNQRQAVGIQPGASINSSGARDVADTVRRQLADAGYRQASVNAQLLPAGPQEVDFKLTIDRGPRFEVRQVRFTGQIAIPESELKRALRPYHVPYSDAAIQAGVGRLQSLYASLGYFDAHVTLADVHLDGADVTLTFSIQSGPQYLVNGRQFAAQDICACLRDGWSESERRGILDFDARLELERTADPSHVWLVARTTPGQPYTLGRIEFRGNHRFGDLTLRRALVLQEGARFDWERLRRSVVRLNRLNLFEPLGDPDVQVSRDPAARRADVTFTLREKSRGRWYLSGPVAPLAIAGPLQASLVARLPAWGQGLFEGSTWYASASLLTFSQPIALMLPFTPHHSRFLPLLGLGRPLLPGQGWFSGVAFSPQLGWKAALASYVMAQGNRGALGLLRSDSPGALPLVVPIQWSDGTPAGASALICQPPKSSWSALRSVGGFASGWLLGAPAF